MVVVLLLMRPWKVLDVELAEDARVLHETESDALDGVAGLALADDDRSSGLGGGRRCPQREAIRLVAYANGRAVHVRLAVSAVAGADQAEEGVHPDGVRVDVALVAARHVDDDATAVLVGRVLPHGLDALLEEHVVAAVGQTRHRSHVVEHAPEVLHKRDAANAHHVVLPLARRLLLVEPERPRVAKRMLAAREASGRQGRQHRLLLAFVACRRRRRRRRRRCLGCRLMLTRATRAKAGVVQRG